MSFLCAQWRNLVLANYEVEEEILESYIPKGTKLDLWNNKAYLSLVGFMFIDTRLLGLKIPFHINFEEVNLRFYVKRKINNEIRRGVVFIKEIVPKHMITFVANTIYNENYETLKMDHEWKVIENKLSVNYGWFKHNKWNKIVVNALAKATDMELGSKEEFITEHYWGYAKNGNKTNEYEVTHPRWQVHKVIDFQIDVDFTSTYGKQFGFLNAHEPQSVMLAKGSKITVENKSTLKC